MEDGGWRMEVKDIRRKRYVRNQKVQKREEKEVEEAQMYLCQTRPEMMIPDDTEKAGLVIKRRGWKRQDLPLLSCTKEPATLRP